MAKHYNLVIVGGGAAGNSVASQMRRAHKKMSIAMIEPSEVHYYQPAFTIVGAGAFKLKNTRRKTAKLLPKNVTWIKSPAAAFEPEKNVVSLVSGEQLQYDFLVVCPGLQLDWHKIDGLMETLGKNGVCSNYAPNTVEYTWECVQALNAGDTAVFTQPPMPIKCAGAPQKILYLTADRLRKRKLLGEVDLAFYNAGPGMFGVPMFAKILDKTMSDYGVNPDFGHNLVAVDGDKQLATFVTTDAAGKMTKVVREFDMLHVSPPQSAPDFIKQSPLANEAGWVDVDHHTLQHNRYPNIFSLGDVACTPNAKTAAAVRKQVPVVVANIIRVRDNALLDARYDGYGSCPLTVSLNKVLLAEFVYGGEITPTFKMDPFVPRRFWWWGKTTGFPWLYWRMVKGDTFDIPHSAEKAEKYINQDD